MCVQTLQARSKKLYDITRATPTPRLRLRLNFQAHVTFGTRLSAKKDAIIKEWQSLVMQSGFARYIPAKATPTSDSTLFLSRGSKYLIDYSGRALTLPCARAVCCWPFSRCPLYLATPLSSAGAGRSMATTADSRAHAQRCGEGAVGRRKYHHHRVANGLDHGAFAPSLLLNQCNTVPGMTSSVEHISKTLMSSCGD
jgi:hypothetical protein